MSTTMDTMENNSTLSLVHLLDYLNVTRTNIVANGHIIVNSCRVLRVDLADIIAPVFVGEGSPRWDAAQDGTTAYLAQSGPTYLFFCLSGQCDFFSVVP